MISLIDFIVFGAVLLAGVITFILLQKRRRKNVTSHSINPDPPIDQFFRSLDDLT